MDLKKLAAKFAPEDIEWRIQQSGKGSTGNYWALVIPYITNRAIMQRLDDVVGAGKWKNEFIPSPCGTGYQCGISIKVEDEWITRWDGAEKSGGAIDNVKTTMSNSMKRTGVQWGIGRYLYHFDSAFATTMHCDRRGKEEKGFTYHENKKKNERFQWQPPALPSWAMPFTEKDVKAYIESMENAEDAKTLKGLWQMAYKAATSENNDEFLERLTKAKDLAKERLTEEAEQANKVAYEALARKVSEQIKFITTASNESSVNSLRELALVEIKNHARGENLAQALKEIKQAAQQRINILKGE